MRVLSRPGASIIREVSTALEVVLRSGHIVRVPPGVEVGELLSLVQTCKHQAIDPFPSLRAVIDRVSTHPISRLAELTPREWKRLHPDALRRRAAA